jgi:hypothetical protein
LGQGIRIGFDQAAYTGRPGLPVAIGVELDSPVPAGLFSYGVVLFYDPVAGRVTDLNSIIVPPQLDFNGVAGPGAFKQVADGTAGAKGTVDFFAQSGTDAYTGRLLATFNFLPQTPGEYLLSLTLFNTLGPTESIFIAGDGSKLDDIIGFGTARLEVIPEPTSLALLMWGGLAIFLKRSLKLRHAPRRSGRR